MRLARGVGVSYRCTRGPASTLACNVSERIFRGTECGDTRNSRNHDCAQPQCRVDVIERAREEDRKRRALHRISLLAKHSLIHGQHAAVTQTGKLERLQGAHQKYSRRGTGAHAGIYSNIMHSP